MVVVAGMKKTNDHAEPIRVTLTGLSLTEQKKQQLVNIHVKQKSIIYTLELHTFMNAKNSPCAWKFETIVNV